MSRWNHVSENVRGQKDIRAMLLIKRTVKLIVAAIAVGFFAGSGKMILF